MAKIRNSNPKQSGGGYERLVVDADMASIFTKAQSTVISKFIEKYNQTGKIYADKISLTKISKEKMVGFLFAICLT